jgi:hypothetical protein
MRLNRGWLYGGGAYVLGITMLAGLGLATQNASLYVAAIVTSLPCSILALYLSYFASIAAVLLLNADPSGATNPLWWFLGSAIWTAAAAGNVALALAASGCFRSNCLPRLRWACGRLAPHRT